MKRIFRKFQQIKGAAEPKPDPREEDYEPENEVVSIPSVSEVRSLSLQITFTSYMYSKYRDPLHVLLNYIVKVSGADRFHCGPR